MGQCYERLGQEGALKAYSRIVNEFADQPDVAEQALTRLISLGGSGQSGSAAAMSVRKVWADDMVDLEGRISPDGRYLSFVDKNSGNLWIRDLVAGENRQVLDRGSQSAGWQEFALDSRWSPNGDRIAYTWLAKDRTYEIRIVSLSDSQIRVLIPGQPNVETSVLDWSRGCKVDSVGAICRQDRSVCSGIAGHTAP